MSESPYYIAQAMLTALFFLGSIALLVFSLAKIPSIGRPAGLVAVGIGLLIFARVVGMLMHWAIARWAGGEPSFLMYLTFQNVPVQILHFAAIVVLVVAAFSSRRGTRPSPPPGGPLAQPENPYSGHL